MRGGAYCAAVLVLVALLSAGLEAQPSARPQLALLGGFDLEEVARHAKALTSFGSRFTGYPGYYEAVKYVNSTLRDLGLEVEVHRFPVAVPYDLGATIFVGNERARAYHLYPNLVALGSAGVVEGELAYVGRGEGLSQVDLSGKIAVLEFESGSRWVDALVRGAKALVFLGPARDRMEALAKISTAPLDVPRVYVEGEGAALLREAAKRGLKARIEGAYEWRRVEAYNVVARVPGSSEPEKVVVLAAHLDSGSVVPALSLGAEEAVNVGLLLHLAKLLKEWRPRYTVWLLFLSGHWQGLAGARWFVEDYFFGGKQLFGTRVGESAFPYIVLNFDLSSGNPKLAVYPGGFFYGHRNDAAMWLYTTFRRSLEGWLREFYALYPDDCMALVSEALFYKPDTGTVLLGSFATGYAIGCSQSFYLDAEPFQLARVPALTLLSFKDPRVRVFTPSDTLDAVDWGNLLPQVRFSLFVVERVLSDLSAVHAGPWDSISPTRRQVEPGVYGGYGFMSVSVEVVRYDPTLPTLYARVPNALVVVHKIDWALNSVGSLAVTVYDPPFGKIIEMADENGLARVVGVAPPEIGLGNIEVYAYKVENGRLRYVPDIGPYGTGRFLPYSTRVTLDTVYRAVVFEAAALAIPRAIDPSRPWPLGLTNLYFKPSFYVPFSQYIVPYPVFVRIFYPNFAAPDSYGYSVDFLRDLVLLFAPPNSRVCAIVSVGGQQRRSVLLLNYSGGEVRGYKLGEAGSLTVVRAEEVYTSEMAAVARERYEQARSAGVVDPTTEELLRLLDQAGWSGLARWSIALKLYERTFGMSMDFAMATLVTILALVPFAVVAEKLLLGHGGMRRVAALVAVAACAYAFFALAHPGFSVVRSSSTLALSVVAIALATPAAFFLLLNLSRVMGQVRAQRLGLHELRREAFDLFIAAVSTGIENMKRRKLRSALTLLTVTFVVISLVSITSVVPVYRVRGVEFESAAPFNGVVLRSPATEPIDPAVVDALKQLVGERGVVAPRYWLYPPLVFRPLLEGGAELVDRFAVTAKNGRKVFFKAVVGVSYHELSMSMKGLGLDPEMLKYVPNGCILPKSAAQMLGVEIGDSVEFLGHELVVVGFFDEAAAQRSVRDVPDTPVEGYGIAPYDVAELMQRGTGGLPVAFTPYRIPWSDILVVNCELLSRVPGAFMQSIAVALREGGDGDYERLAHEVFTAFDGLEVWYAYNGRGRLLSSRYYYELFGFSFVAIPVVIGGLSLVLAILGSVHERMREASVYSALGLAPAHVGGMFLAEVVVYAIVGVVAGYAAGIVAARLFNFAAATGGYIGMNYSSSSVLTSLAIVAAMVLAASLYPFARVSKLVTPSLERRWRVPTKPRGDVWEIPLPFTFREEEMAAGLVAYLSEYLENRRERVGTFAVMEHSPLAEPGRVGVRARVWLAPYEQDIVQDARLVFARSPTEARYQASLLLRRLSGPYDLWVKSCEAFVREVREQLLTWRLLTPEDRRKYVKLGLSMVRGGG
jgi:hypothetical protein